jgi:hypothetical protein
MLMFEQVFCEGVGTFLEVFDPQEHTLEDREIFEGVCRGCANRGGCALLAGPLPTLKES